MLRETVIRLDSVPETLYALHQRVWQMLACSGVQQRDFLYAIDHGDLYVRAGRDRGAFGPWREVTPPLEGHSYVVVGTLAIDATRTRVRGQEAFGWRHPTVLDRRVRPLFERFMRIESLSISPVRSLPFGKSGCGRIFFTPLRVRAEGIVSDGEIANYVLERGIGRARGLGFGVLHFIAAKE